MPTRRCSVPSAASLAGPILAAMSALAAVPALADAAAAHEREEAGLHFGKLVLECS